ncbi:hypothetical protein ACWOAQ_05350 [Helcococcus kunzii]|uniref:Uncharacterized protein n=2 Tax=Helcococcus kunzii TaxID=40091 RepID=H3NQZ0_9FIRM|nr:hypothetical protein [Helcococcus kunzii]EHR31938.1 hypothetical protein HMPREF9709_01751 [Helcococcus kunzii ATCC 51366]QUY65670.1 hypothetical protein GUI37_09110 [Helcococcus kunzii]QZO76383.1 hypothetical protein HIF96_08885 [Helcococcus kunzii]
MNNDDNNQDMKIQKIRKISSILGANGIILILIIIISNLSYPNILYSIFTTIAIALVFIAAGLAIATWIMEINLAYKRKQYLSILILILTGIFFILLIFRR